MKDPAREPNIRPSACRRVPAEGDSFLRAEGVESEIVPKLPPILPTGREGLQLLPALPGGQDVPGVVHGRKDEQNPGSTVDVSPRRGSLIPMAASPYSTTPPGSAMRIR